MGLPFSVPGSVLVSTGVARCNQFVRKGNIKKAKEEGGSRKVKGWTEKQHWK